MARALIVDDDPVGARLVCKYLQRAGHDVVIRTDGRSGLDRALSDPPDLVILDVMMPHVDGWEMLRRVQERHGRGSIPVVMFSGKTEGAAADAKARGARGFIGKPFDPQQLIDSTKQLLPV